MMLPFPQRKARACSLALTLVILAIITFWNLWWPGILLAIGLPSALRQGLMKHTTDMVATLIVFVGSFVVVLAAGMSGKVTAAILLFAGSLYVFFKEMKAEKKKEL
jgi:predicted membrane protein